MKCIFRNRLATEEQQDQFEQLLQSESRTLFDIDQTNHFFVPSGTQLQYTTQQDWTDIVKRNITICSEYYFNFNMLRFVSLNFIEYFMKNCCSSFSDTEDIVLYTVVNDLLLETTASICRTLSRIESHILLVGPTGTLKIDALHIACAHLAIKIASITPVNNYNTNDFFNDLKMVHI